MFWPVPRGCTGPGTNGDGDWTVKWHLEEMAAWLSGNALVSINIVALHRARLVLGWMTVCGYTILLFINQSP